MKDTHYRHMPSVKRGGKRQRQAKEALNDADVCPFKGMIRNAMKAENAKQYGVAGKLWGDLASYIQPKFKAIDPLEQAAKAKDIMSLEDLSRMKQAVMSGDIEQVKQAIPQVIDNGELL